MVPKRITCIPRIDLQFFNTDCGSLVIKPETSEKLESLAAIVKIIKGHNEILRLHPKKASR